MYRAISDHTGAILARDVDLETACVIAKRHANQTGDDVRIVSRFGKVVCTIRPD